MSHAVLHWFRCDSCGADSPAFKDYFHAVAAAKAVGWAFLCRWVGQKGVESVEFCPDEKCRASRLCLDAACDSQEIRSKNPS